MLISTHFHPSEKRPAALQVRGLNGGPGELLLFKDLNLQLPPGLSALLGDEGSGKTSLLRLLCGDLTPQSGEIEVRGEVAAVLPPQGSVFWTDLRLPHGDEHTPGHCWDALAPLWPAWSEQAQQSWCTALQLTPHLDKRLNMLSTGTRRKVGLVAALASGAAVTLLDQPFVSLDQASIRVLQDMLADSYRDSERACLIADYEKPPHMPWAAVFQL
ncbi:ATP-binding cassette domain-containing protein [Limnohabitans sp. G3-2]|uniref:ABC transporter ATP-binding protein n=1 Tax=Limnohabitans sp. G3-2 TaxID=1100711 RepID=UPI000C1E2F1C|nr:ATP-binding cassette domain-containing protein [Limnohabitans sp. G3-2]PIT73984.1 hypothetical protein B9Z31_09025 [Limnohabitans sp. G3-2]